MQMKSPLDTGVKSNFFKKIMTPKCTTFKIDRTRFNHVNTKASVIQQSNHISLGSLWQTKKIDIIRRVIESCFYFDSCHLLKVNSGLLKNTTKFGISEKYHWSCFKLCATDLQVLYNCTSLMRLTALLPYFEADHFVV